MGEVTWNGEGAERALVLLTDQFHVEEGRLPGARHVIICNHCDEIDPPRLAASTQNITVRHTPVLL
jgi:hypothetical protein